MTINTEAAREALIKEKALLEASLSEIATRNPQNPDDWEPRDTPIDVMEADQNEFADRIETRLGNQAEQDLLERRHRDVTRAIEKIDAGTYGICEIASEPIEEDRLTANPAARTCKAHMERENELPL